MSEIVPVLRSLVRHPAFPYLVPFVAALVAALADEKWGLVAKHALEVLVFL